MALQIISFFRAPAHQPGSHAKAAREALEVAASLLLILAQGFVDSGIIRGEEIANISETNDLVKAAVDSHLRLSHPFVVECNKSGSDGV